MSSREFEDVLIARFGCDRDQAEAAWSEVLGAVGAALLSGRAVSLIRVGTIKPYLKQASSYRDPRTGEVKAIPPRWHIKYAISPEMKARFQHPDRETRKALVQSATANEERVQERAAQRQERLDRARELLNKAEARLASVMTRIPKLRALVSRRAKGLQRGKATPEKRAAFKSASDRLDVLVAKAHALRTTVAEKKKRVESLSAKG